MGIADLRFKGPFRVDFMSFLVGFDLRDPWILWMHRAARNWSLVAHATFLNELLLHVQKNLMALSCL